MTGPRNYARRQDANQAQIVSALRGLGVEVQDLSGAGGGVPDLVAFWRGQTIWIELKNLDGRGKKLTAAQLWFHNAARAGGVTIHVVTNVDEALAIFGARRAA